MCVGHPQIAAYIKCCLPILFWFQETNNKIKARCKIWFFYPQWYPEVNHFCRGVPLVLIGCKTDLRKDKEQLRKLRAARQEPITYSQVHSELLKCWALGRTQSTWWHCSSQVWSHTLHNEVIQVKRWLTAPTEVSLSSFWRGQITTQFSAEEKCEQS